MKTNAGGGGETMELLKLPDAARLLSVSVRTLHRLAGSNVGLRILKVGRSSRIARLDLIEYVNSLRKGARP